MRMRSFVDNEQNTQGKIFSYTYFETRERKRDKQRRTDRK